MADPFLSINEFAAEYGSLSTGQTTTATRLLQVVSDYIRGKKPDVDVVAASQVVFEIVRDAITFGPYERLAQFENDTSKRKEAGTFVDAATVLDQLLLDRHKRLLGIALRAAPRGVFKKCDY